MEKKHSISFKLEAVEKAINRQPEETLADYARQFGIGFSTLTRWMNQVKRGELTTARSSKEKRPSDWTAAEKLRAVIETGTLTDQAKGRYCREHGLFEHHLTCWKEEFMTGSKEKYQEIKAENRALKDANKQLTRELARKEKALAETAALLVLKKKARAIFGPDEDI